MRAIKRQNTVIKNVIIGLSGLTNTKISMLNTNIKKIHYKQNMECIWSFGVWSSKMLEK